MKLIRLDAKINALEETINFLTSGYEVCDDTEEDIEERQRLAKKLIKQSEKLKDRRMLELSLPKIDLK